MSSVEDWNIFAQGHWTQEPFIKPGIYPIAPSYYPETLESPSWNLAIVVEIERKLVIVTGGWEGYHWSVPLPKLPAVKDKSY